jgi:hypothetical protein
MMDAAISLAPGKECATCAMCCKVYEFADLKKKKGWCENFKLGVGCTIYATRPEPCRAFYCNWMLIEALGPEWKPNVCKFVMTYDPSRSILVQVDTSYPTAWRAKPYYDSLREWAVRLKAEKRFIFILVGKNLTVMTAEGEYDLGFFDSSHDLKMRTEKKGFEMIDVPYKIKKESTAS